MADEFAESCHAAFGDRVHCLVAPLLRVTPLRPGTLPPHRGGIIFTSRSAVAVVREFYPELTGTAFCVGARTAADAEKAGFSAISADADADGLIRLIAKARPTGPLLHLHGRHTRGDIAATLSAQGVATASREIYHQRPLGLSGAARELLGSGRPCLVPLFSPRTAGLFQTAVGPNPPAALRVLALSAAVAEAYGQTIEIAARPNAEAMLELMAETLSETDSS
ncbi:MAG: uroporphyrinogen-III synthase [Pseudomonadota bacterium]